MYDSDELRALAESIRAQTVWEASPGIVVKLLNCSDGLLALLDEIEALRKDAGRYRWLSDRFIGCDFDWMPSEENAGDGKSVLCFEIGRNCRVWGDSGMTIDAAMTQGGGA